MLMFRAYTFIFLHTLTGGLKRRFGQRCLSVVEWLNHNQDVYFADIAALGFVWA